LLGTLIRVGTHCGGLFNFFGFLIRFFLWVPLFGGMAKGLRQSFFPLTIIRRAKFQTTFRAGKQATCFFHPYGRLLPACNVRASPMIFSRFLLILKCCLFFRDLLFPACVCFFSLHSLWADCSFRLSPFGRQGTLRFFQSGCLKTPVRFCVASPPSTGSGEVFERPDFPPFRFHTPSLWG